MASESFGSESCIRLCDIHSDWLLQSPHKKLCVALQQNTRCHVMLRQYLEQQLGLKFILSCNNDVQRPAILRLSSQRLAQALVGLGACCVFDSIRRIVEAKKLLTLQRILSRKLLLIAIKRAPFLGIKKAAYELDFSCDERLLVQLGSIGLQQIETSICEVHAVHWLQRKCTLPAQWAQVAVSKELLLPERQQKACLQLILNEIDEYVAVD